MGDLPLDEVGRHHADDLAAGGEGGVRQLAHQTDVAAAVHERRDPVRPARRRGHGQPSTNDSEAPTLEPQNTHTRNPASPAIGPGSHASQRRVTASKIHASDQ